jgi:hypothetical protein
MLVQNHQQSLPIGGSISMQETGRMPSTICMPKAIYRDRLQQKTFGKYKLARHI